MKRRSAGNIANSQFGAAGGRRYEADAGAKAPPNNDSKTPELIPATGRRGSFGLSNAAAYRSNV
jgi:hypothetical protein